MSGPKGNRAYKFALPAQLVRIKAAREQEECRTVCMWCGRSWDGKLRSTRDRFRAHALKCRKRPRKGGSE